MNHQDEISAFLDAENSVTTRWLANTLRIDMTQARVALSKYKEDQPHVGVSYVVAGVGETSGLTYIIAEELDLDSVRGQFSSTRSEEIYAVHKIRSISNKAEMQALECDQASDLLYMTHPNSAEFYKNSIGHVVCPSMDVKPIGQRILSSKITVSSEQPSQVKEVIKTSVNKVLTPAAAPVAVAKSKSSIQATSFFGAATARPSKPTAETAPAVKEKSVEASPDAVKSEVKVQVKAEEEAPEAAPVKRVGRIACDDEDDEFDSEYKPDAARLKERVDAIAASSKTSVSMGAVEDSADVDVDMSEETEGGDAKAARKKGKQVVKHGAMDDYMEDIAIAAHNKAEATPADAPKPKKRKLVEKMFADAKGYLVTEMVWEEVTDDEGETTVAVGSSHQPTKRPKPDDASADSTNKENGDGNKEKKAAAAPAAAKGAKKVVEPPKAQKSMMSFFGKK